ncbi:hypothetical protein Tco_1014509 [Tanacetum coccineum]
MTISELKNKIKIIEKGKNVNTKFDKSETSGTLLYVTPLPKNIAVKDKKVSNTKVNADRSKPVTSYSIPKNEKSQKQSANVIARGMYRITKTEKQTPDSKINMNGSNSTGVESSNNVRRPKSKDTKSKDRVLKRTNDKRPSAHVQKMPSSVSIDFNKHETMNSTICQSNASVLNTKTVNAVNDDSNIVCVSCGKDMFLLSHEKCVARYALSYCLGHNLFSVGQFCDGDLEVAFRSNTCYVRNLEGDDLLTGSRESNLYTISISEMAASSPICLMSKATSTKSWLWHRRLSH